MQGILNKIGPVLFPFIVKYRKYDTGMLHICNNLITSKPKEGLCYFICRWWFDYGIEKLSFYENKLMKQSTIKKCIERRHIYRLIQLNQSCQECNIQLYIGQKLLYPQLDHTADISTDNKRCTISQYYSHIQWPYKKIYKYTIYTLTANNISEYPIYSTFHMQRHIMTYCKPS